MISFFTNRFTGFSSLLSRLLPPKTASGAVSSGDALSDQIFWMMFYLCVGFLPPFVAIIGHKAVFIPFMIISVLIFIRVLIRNHCRERMTGYWKTPAIVLLLGFTLFVLLHSLYDIGQDPGRIRILTKPFALLQATLLLTFIWSHRDLVQTRLILKLAFVGCIAGIVITVLKIVMLYTFWEIDHAVTMPSLVLGFLKIHDTIHGELKIVSVFLFAAVFVIKDAQKRLYTLVLLLTVLMLLSFSTIGVLDGLLMIDYNETVQFGLPVALLVLLLASLAPRLMTHLFFSSLVFILVTAPWVFQIWYQLIQSLSLPRARKFLVRGEIWDGVGSKALENPFFGFGIDSLRSLGHVDLKNLYMPNDDMLHPHNMVLQLWIDLGVAGIFFVVALVLLGWGFVNRCAVSARPPLLAGLAMFTIFSMVSHSVWQIWSMAMMTFFILLISIHDPKSEKG